MDKDTFSMGAWLGCDADELPEAVYTGPTGFESTMKLVANLLYSAVPVV
jgi:hypothetical protein